MAIIILPERRQRYQGLSTDTKPTDDQIADGATFYEIDTKKIYVFHGGEWYPGGANTEWE